MAKRRAVETAAIRFDIVDEASSLPSVTSSVGSLGGRIRALATVRRIDGDPPVAEIELEVEGMTEEALVERSRPSRTSGPCT